MNANPPPTLRGASPFMAYLATVPFSTYEECVYSANIHQVL